MANCLHRSFELYRNSPRLFFSFPLLCLPKSPEIATFSILIGRLNPPISGQRLAQVSTVNSSSSSREKLVAFYPAGGPQFISLAAP